MISKMLLKTILKIQDKDTFQKYLEDSLQDKILLKRYLEDIRKDNIFKILAYPKKLFEDTIGSL